MEQDIYSEKFIETVFLFCYKHINNRQDSEDLTQEIMLEAMKTLRSGRKIHSFYPWFWQMARNKCSRFLHLRSKNAVSLEFLGGSIPSDFSAPDFELIKDEEISELNFAVSRISSVHREIIILFYLRELPISEIAKRLSIPEGTVKRRLSDAKENIKKGMDENMKSTGKKAYAPAILDLWGSYNIPKHWNYLNDIMAKQILVICNKQASSVQEISDEIGVAPIYMQKNFDYLINNKFIKEKGKGRYITDFLIFPEQVNRDAHYEQSKIFENIGAEVIKVIDEAKESIQNLDFYGNDFDYGYLKWILIVYASTKVCDLISIEYQSKWKGKVNKDNGKDYRISGSVRYADENLREYDIKSVDWSNLHSSYKTSAYRQVEYANLFQAAPFGERDHYVNDKNINTLMKIYNDSGTKLTKNEEEQAAEFIKYRILIKSGEGYKLNIPVMSYPVRDMIHTIFENAFAPYVNKYVEDVIKLGEKILLPHVREDLLEEFVHWGIGMMFNPLNYVFYYAMNTPGVLSIPENYSKSAAGLAIYYIK